MKWTSFLGVLVLSFGLCSQTFGFELLDRILGIGNSGCCESSCGCEAEPECGCEAEPECGCEAEPECGCEAEPECGCEAEPDCGCEAEPDCGCEAEPDCGCESDGSCKSQNRVSILGSGGLLASLFSGKGCCDTSGGCEAEPECGCEAEPECGCEAEPECGCEAEPDCGCDTGCNKRSRRTLLDDLLGGLRKSCGCDTADCCDAGGDVDAEEAAPMPPAPIVDPSAFVPQKRRVVQASTTTIVR